MWFFLALALLSQSTTHLDMAYAGTTAQLTEWDCAQACAATLLDWAELSPDPELWADLIQPGQPITFRHLQDYFAGCGVEAVGYRLSWEALTSFLHDNPGSPLLAHLGEGRGHFVLVVDAGPPGILTADPAHGVHFTPASDFEETWSGVVLYFPQLHQLPTALAAGEEAYGRTQILTEASYMRP
ncbi:MAG: hypothetical protein GX195_07630 [Firmicutes bacterium]|nr:hypothetical protein [Bacillota bacterium]